MSDKYKQALDKFTQQYSNTKGVVKIEADEFGIDYIVVLIDDLRYKKIELPLIYMEYEVHTVGLYSLLKTYESIVHTYVVHDPSFWDAETQVPFQSSLTKINKLVSDYENKVNQNIDDSLLRIKKTMEWISIHNPPPRKAKRRR